MQLMRRAGRKTHGRFHFVTDLANKFTVQSRCGLPVLAKYKHFCTIREQVPDNFHTMARSSF